MVRSPLEPEMELNLSGYRSLTRGDRRVVLYAAALRAGWLIKNEFSSMITTGYLKSHLIFYKHRKSKKRIRNL